MPKLTWLSTKSWHEDSARKRQCQKGNTMIIKTAYFLVKTTVKLKDNSEACFPFHIHLFPVPIKVILADFIGGRSQENLNGWFKRSICFVLALQNKSQG